MFLGFFGDDVASDRDPAHVAPNTEFQHRTSSLSEMQSVQIDGSVAVRGPPIRAASPGHDDKLLAWCDKLAGYLMFQIMFQAKILRRHRSNS